MKITKRNIAKCLSFTAMLFGVSTVIVGVFQELNNGKIDNIYFLIGGFTFLFLGAKYVIDFNMKNKRNDSLWIAMTSSVAVTLFVLFFYNL